MRARFVNEFHKTGDPLRSLSLGSRHFTSDSEFMERLVSLLPNALGTDEIPDDIILSNAHLINEGYIDIIRNYINNGNFSINGIKIYIAPPYDMKDDVEGYDGYIWHDLHDKLKSMGYYDTIWGT